MFDFLKSDPIRSGMESVMYWKWDTAHPRLHTLIEVSSLVSPCVYAIAVIVGANLIHRIAFGSREKRR